MCVTSLVKTHHRYPLMVTVMSVFRRELHIIAQKETFILIDFIYFCILYNFILLWFCSAEGISLLAANPGTEGGVSKALFQNPDLLTIRCFL
jgi:hypothetical protein